MLSDEIRETYENKVPYYEAYSKLLKHLYKTVKNNSKHSNDNNAKIKSTLAINDNMCIALTEKLEVYESKLDSF